MAHLSIHLLGEFTVSLDGQEARGLQSDKTRALLAYLAVEAGRPHRRDALAALLWSEQPEERAHGSLSQALYNLRQVMGERTTAIPILIVDHQSVQLNPQCDCRVDARLFSELIEACQRHAHARPETCTECAAVLRQAAEIYRGGFLEDFNLAGALGFEEWALLTRERLGQQALGALAGLAAYHEGKGEIAQALAYTRRCVELDPFWEAGQRSLMRTLALDEKVDAALAQYRKFRRLLANELGLEPDHETQALCKRLQQEAQGSAAMDHLPAHLTPFVGRQEELAELGALLCDPGTRLVTVLGAGGSGKTRLALQAAGRLRYHFTNDVYFVPLSNLATPLSLLPVVALALGFKFKEGSDPAPQLLEYLHGKHLLLLLDSFETVLEGAGWLSELLRLASGVKALVTSRVRLNIKGEHIFPLSGMSYPEPEITGEASFAPAQYNAMQLFLASAQSIQASQEWGKDSWRDLAKICRLVQGMPLGLLLASAWVDTYTLAEIAAEIERSLDFLEATWVGVPERQRSLRATLDYSYRLLSPDEQELLCRLSVFQGGFTRRAATLVAEATALSLRGLVDKSMLQVQAAGRYAIHDLVQQYAEQKLGETGALQSKVRDRHSAFYLERMAGWERELKSARQRQVLEEIDWQIGDVQIGWLWAAAQTQIGRLAGALEGMGTYFELRQRYAEGSAACRAALDGLAGREEHGAASLRGWLQAWQARYCRLLGEVEQARELREASQAALVQAEALGEDTRRGQALLG